MPAHLMPLAVALAVAQLAPPPPTPVHLASDSYFGVRVDDPYRWLEQAADPAVQAWTTAQDARTRATLATFPGRAALKERVRTLLVAAAGHHQDLEFRAGTWFALRYQPPRQQPLLVALTSLDDLSTERVLLDPVVLDPSGSTTIDFFVPSPGGELVAVSLSEKGTESGTVRIVEVPTGRELPDRIPRVNGGTAGGSLAWAPGRTGFWYTRYPSPGERPAPDLPFYQEVWFHELGSPAGRDVYALGRQFVEPRIAEHALQASEDGQQVLDLVEQGDGGRYSLYVRRPAGDWREVAAPGDGVVQARLGPDGGLWLLSLKEDPRGTILRVPWGEPDLARATVMARAGEGAIERFEVTSGRLYVAEIAGGPSVLRRLDLSGRPLGVVPTEPVTAVTALRRGAPGQLVFAISSYLAPVAWFGAADDGPAPRRLAISSRSPVDFSDVEVLRELATSKDGTQVPISILQRRSTPRDGRNPVLLYGYGGYGLSVTPEFVTARRILLDHGFVLAEANIRGGGEYGDGWHRAGNLTHKQNVFDDFAACAQHLIDRKYTSPDRLALRGGSNGGLLMGAMITQHPGLARAVIAQVGIFDMLRVEQTSNGAFNVTEYGTVKDQAQFEALLGYSPYHHVKNGTAYPAVLLTAGANDPRVDAWHAKKMAARLQASGSKAPVLLRVAGFGHGMGTPLDERIDEAADLYAFLFTQLGVTYQAATARVETGPR